MAHLPFQRTLEQFDFAFQPSIDERQVKELANLAFVSEATNILLLGPPGVGKTHLAIALALKAIEKGQGAYFVRAYDGHVPSSGVKCVIVLLLFRRLSPPRDRPPEELR